MEPRSLYQRPGGSDAFSVPAAEQVELIAILAPLRPDIVEVETPDTGTVLPDGYRNAPPLVHA